MARKVKKCHRSKCSASWICRACSAKCCEHLCVFKKSDGSATCVACVR